MSDIGPGCYGLPSAFGSSALCKTCLVNDQCRSAAKQVLDELKPLIDVERVERMHDLFDASLITPAERPKASVTVRSTDPEWIHTVGNAKAVDLVRSIHRKAPDLWERLTSGHNPFHEQKPAFMKVACDELLRDGFTLAGLKANLMHAFAWTEATAASHVSIVKTALVACGIITHVGNNRYKLRR